MSFREIRNFCEIMRSLGYPRIISMENFRTPNFELVADILDWLLNRVDPENDITDDIEDERQRINFITNIAKFFLSKTRIRLNMRKLYQADGYAVRELLKIANMLYRAQSSSNKDEEDSGIDITKSSKLQNLSGAKTLASEITESGAKLFDLLGKEKELREAREKALGFLDNISRNLDSGAEQDYIKRCIRDIIQNQTGSLSQMEKMLEELEKDEKNLEAKIKKRSSELERAEKRMKSLQTVRPAFMDEYERVEQELQKLYEAYVVKFRNLAYLENDLEKYSQKEQEREQQANKILDDERRKIQEEEIKILRGEQEGDPSRDSNMMRGEGMKDRPTEARSNKRQSYMQESDDSDLIDDVDEDDSESLEVEDDENSESTDNDF